MVSIQDGSQKLLITSANTVRTYCFTKYSFPLLESHYLLAKPAESTFFADINLSLQLQSSCQCETKRGRSRMFINFQFSTKVLPPLKKTCFNKDLDNSGPVPHNPAGSYDSYDFQARLLRERFLAARAQSGGAWLNRRGRRRSNAPTRNPPKRWGFMRPMNVREHGWNIRNTLVLGPQNVSPFRKSWPNKFICRGLMMIKALHFEK